MAYSPPDYGGYERQKADTQYKYSNDSITNAYGRFISQQRGERGLGDMYRGYQRQFPTYTSQFGRRGLAGGGINSGVMRNSMNNYIGDFARDYGRGINDLTNQLQQYDLNQVNLDSWRQQQMQAIEAEKQRAIANDAAQLEYLRTMVGGL